MTNLTHSMLIIWCAFLGGLMLVTAVLLLGDEEHRWRVLSGFMGVVIAWSWIRRR